MPTLGQLKKFIVANALDDGNLPFDSVREASIRMLSDYTGRATIVYASHWSEPGIGNSVHLNIDVSDVQGFMEVLSNIDERELDLIIHSGGGDVHAAEAIVEYLRSKFDHIRVFVPVSAMSAASMIALSADEVVLGRHSHLGPIDLQMPLHTSVGLQFVPAAAVLSDFEDADEAFRRRGLNTAWRSIVDQVPPGFISQCRAGQARARKMVAGWMQMYMFNGRDDAETAAIRIANELTNFTKLGYHARPIDLQQARKLGIEVTSLEDDDVLQDRVLSVFHATYLTFNGTPARKIIENHRGRGWIRDESPTP